VLLPICGIILATVPLRVLNFEFSRQLPRSEFSAATALLWNQLFICFVRSVLLTHRH
jgi:hypothetical protein